MYPLSQCWTCGFGPSLTAGLKDDDEEEPEPGSSKGSEEAEPDWDPDPERGELSDASRSGTCARGMGACRRACWEYKHTRRSSRLCLSATGRGWGTQQRNRSVDLEGSAVFGVLRVCASRCVLCVRSREDGVGVLWAA